MIQGENPALPAKDERSDAQSEPRTEQGGSESRKLWLEHVADIDFEMIEKYEWTQQLDEAEFSLSCQVCGNTVKSDGITATIGERTLAFCCPSCKSTYEREFEEFQANSG